MKLQIKHGDILKEHVDVIMNPANEQLQNIGGLARKISNVAGPEMEADLSLYLRSEHILPTTDSYISVSGDLKNCKAIIHTVGPMVTMEGYDMLLYLTIFNAFLTVDKAGFNSLAFPAISTGIFGIPFEIALEQYVSAFNIFSRRAKNIEDVRLILFDHKLTEPQKIKYADNIEI